MITIVIVEDEYRTREGIGKLIEKLDLGFTVVGMAENGYDGLKMIQATEPDLVITDIQMPKMDGLEMIEKAREIGFEGPYVMLSSYGTIEYAQRAIRLGVKDYLLKPITISAIRELLTKIKEEMNGETQEEDYSAYSGVVEEMIKVIQVDYGKHLSLDNFADKYKFSVQYLSNLFSRETGMTFSNYVKKVRMEKAKELIRTTDYKIYEIACLVGYPDQKYFSKVFREYCDVNPKQYALQSNLKKE